MKKTVLVLVLVLCTVFCSFALASCGKKGNTDTNEQNNSNNNSSGNNDGGNQTGENTDSKTTPPTVVPGETVESDVDCVNSDWAKQELLIMSVNDCSDNNVIQAGGRGYVAGNNQWTTESAIATDAILKKAIQRNSDAAAYANVSLAYAYSDKGWGKATTMISENVASGVSGMPDIYYDSVYDMVASSIKGNFKNILDNQYFTGDGATAADGYNRDYMDNIFLLPITRLISPETSICFRLI